MLKWFKKIKKQLLPRRKTKLPSIDFAEFKDDDNMAWWGSFFIDHEQSRYLKIGNVVICIDRLHQEWLMACYREGEDKKVAKKLGVHLTKGELVLKPVLPDRPILYAVNTVLFLPPKTDITLYVSVPVYLRVEIGNSNLVLYEMPTRLLSDTWSGRNTRTGELCFASSSDASAHLEEVPHDNTQAITVISLSNQSQNNLFIKEIKVPAPFLSVFSDTQNHLWTEPLSICFESDGSTDTTILKTPPKGLKDLTKLCKARFVVPSGLRGLFSPKIRPTL